MLINNFLVVTNTHLLGKQTGKANPNKVKPGTYPN